MQNTPFDKILFQKIVDIKDKTNFDGFAAMSCNDNSEMSGVVLVTTTRNITNGYLILVVLFISVMLENDLLNLLMWMEGKCKLEMTWVVKLKVLKN